MQNQELNPCPFCSMHSESDWEDTLYPSGTAWREDTLRCETFRYYISRNDPRGYHGLCYDLNCATVYGGCGVTITGDSKEEVIEKWNRRFNTTQGENNDRLVATRRAIICAAAEIGRLTKE